MNLVEDIDKEAIEKYRSRCKVLVMGHTHYPVIYKDNDFTYINCGDLIHSYTYVEFDTVTKECCLSRV